MDTLMQDVRYALLSWGRSFPCMGIGPGDLCHIAFPIGLGLASSWDMQAIALSGRVAAIEASADSLDMTFAPMVDIARDQRWGRTMEGAGEDVHLGNLMAEARVRGFQRKDLKAIDSMMACAKHFAAYGAAEAGLVLAEDQQVGEQGLLREGGIPEPVVEFAYTHHGTGVIEYFWHKCVQQGNPKGLSVDSFRYLVVTRVLACMIALPILTTLMNFTGLLGGYTAEAAITGWPDMKCSMITPRIAGLKCCQFRSDRVTTMRSLPWNRWR